jgi:CBS domain-containing protein
MASHHIIAATRAADGERLRYEDAGLPARTEAKPMKVRDLQTSDVQAVNPDTNLAAAAHIMWECDCGVVPVIDHERHLVGMITDRDIAIAATTRSAAPADIQVRHVMSTGELYSCRPDDDVRIALASMGEHRVRRLPVTDRENHLVGILSLNDLVRRVENRAGAQVPGNEFIEALQAISAPVSHVRA